MNSPGMKVAINMAQNLRIRQMFMIEIQALAGPPRRAIASLQVAGHRSIPLRLNRGQCRRDSRILDNDRE